MSGRRWGGRVPALAGMALLVAAAAPAAEPFRHADERYPHLALAWQPLSGAGTAERVWTHPLLPGMVALAGERGLQVSADAGATWSKASGLPEGAVTGLAFHPLRPQECLAATEAGLWRSRDGGRSFAAHPAGGLPAPVEVAYHPRDPGGSLLLVAHGDLGPGLSLSEDGGSTWRLLLANFRVRRIFTGALGDPWTVVLAAPLAEPETSVLLRFTSLSDAPVELSRDCVIADAADPVFAGTMHFASPRDGLIGLEPANRVSLLGSIFPVPTGLAADHGFSAVASCWGAHADRQLLFAFDPYALGCVYTENGSEWYSAGDGLPIGSMVKEGARFRANANGSRFFAVINDQAYVGSPVDRRLDGLAAQVDPPVAIVHAVRYSSALADVSAGLADFAAAADPLAAARALREAADEVDAALQPAVVQMRVRLAAGSAPQRLTVDLSRFGRSADEPLSDDGRHGDGAAGDNVWGTEVRVRPGLLAAKQGEKRRIPGILGLTATAAWPDGTCSGAVAPLLVWRMVESMNLFSGRNTAQMLQKIKIEGATAAASGGGAGFAVTLTAAGGPWRLSIPLGRTVDVAPFSTLALGWRGGPASVRLIDQPLFDEPVETVPLELKDGTPQSGAEGWNEASFPIATLIGDGTAFNRNRLAKVVFSGEAKAGDLIALNAPRFLPDGAGAAP